ncbi:MAG: (deoxy)nucleoside triphosphate pyrophosphohydrolase [Aureispira sp.]
MKKIPPIVVVCGLLKKDKQLMLVQRGPQQSHALQWEFPGGKVEKGETYAAALQREWQEELGVEIRVGQALPSVVVQKENWSIELFPFYCQLVRGTLVLSEHVQQVWLDPQEALQLDLSKGDRIIIESLIV